MFGVIRAAPAHLQAQLSTQLSSQQSGSLAQPAADADDDEYDSNDEQAMLSRYAQRSLVKGNEMLKLLPKKVVEECWQRRTSVELSNAFAHVSFSWSHRLPSRVFINPH